MASTYVNDLRLEEQATGENSGSWGTKLNSSLEQIAEAFSYGSEAIADASTHTITMADGTSDEARSFYLKCTGGGQACTVTLAPSTVSKVWMIENATSYTLTFSQGSGANVAVEAGAVKMIATDGAGSGAVVYDLLTDINVADSLKISGTTPTLTIGDAGAEDSKILFDGNAQDFYIGLDDSADDLLIGTGSTVGSNGIVTIENGGNVGIGTLSPSRQLTVENTIANSGGVIGLTSSDSSTSGTCGIIHFGNSTDSSLASINGIADGATDAGALVFKTEATGGAIEERMRIDSSGNATFSGGQSQTITFFTDSGSSQGDTGLIFKTDGSSANQRIATIFAQQGSGDGASQKGEIVFQVADNGNPATALTISNNKRVTAHSSLLVGLTSSNGMSGNGIESSGSIRANNFILSTDLAGSGFRNLNASANGTITTSTSLRELKENIVDMSLGLSDVLKLKPREFDWKDAEEHGTEDIGFIADEVFDVSPKLATYKAGDKTKDNLQGVKYDTMPSLLVKAIQEQQTIIDDLKSRIKALEEA